MRINWAWDPFYIGNKTGAQTKRPKTKFPKGQNVPRDKMTQGTKRPKGHNVLKDKNPMDFLIFSIFPKATCLLSETIFLKKML